MKIDLNKKEFQIKKNHHYVWRCYLDRWAVKGNGLYYISESGKISQAHAKRLCCEKEFYKVHALTKEDIFFIETFSKKSPESLQRIHMKFLGNFIKVSNGLHALEKVGADSPEYKHLYQLLACNSLEDTHGLFESGVLPVLNELWCENIAILEDTGNMISFCAFIGHQITRSKSFKDVALSNFVLGDSHFRGISDYRTLFERNWWFLSFIFGINLGDSFYHDTTSKHIFIKNNTAIPFITSDNPAINVHPSLATLAENKAPVSMDLFYPLSPELAYMINESDQYDRLEYSISEEDVIKFNTMMATKADRTMFSNCEKTLKSIHKYMRNH